MAKIAQPRMTAQDRKWQAECDMRTLIEAEKIQNDSKRLAAAKREATAQATQAKRIAAKLNRRK